MSNLFYDLRSVGQSFLVSSTHLGPKTRFLLLSDSCWFVDVRRPLWREVGSVIYSCCWFSPAQSFPDPGSAGLMNIFYSLRFETAQPVGLGTLIISPRNLVAELYPQTLVSLLVDSNHSQGYRGVIRIHFNTGNPLTVSHWSSRYSFGKDRTQNTTPIIPLLLHDVIISADPQKHRSQRYSH
jgi:hypothetical protein